jgi:hypothetical protein
MFKAAVLEIRVKMALIAIQNEQEGKTSSYTTALEVYARHKHGVVSPGHYTCHVVYPLTNQSNTLCMNPASGTAQHGHDTTIYSIYTTTPYLLTGIRRHGVVAQAVNVVDEVVRHMRGGRRGTERPRRMAVLEAREPAG